MIKKILTIFVILLIGAACVVSGFLILDKKDSEESAKNEQPGVTITDGRVLAGTGQIKHVEGKITKLTKKKLFLSVQGVDWEMTLPEEAYNNIERMNELGIEVKVGTLVTVQYTLLNEERVVKSLARLDNN